MNEKAHFTSDGFQMVLSHGDRLMIFDACQFLENAYRNQWRRLGDEYQTEAVLANRDGMINHLKDIQGRMEMTFAEELTSFGFKALLDLVP